MHFFGTVTSRVGQDVTPVSPRACYRLLGVLLLVSAPAAQAFNILGSCSAATDDATPIQLAQAASTRTDAGAGPLRLAQGLRASLGLKFDPVLNLEPSSSTDTPVYIFGQSISGQTDDQIEARGAAEFRKLGLFIKGDFIRHNLIRDELYAEGDVKLFREGEFYEGPRLRLKLGTTQGFFDEVTYQLVSTGGRGTARRAEFIQPLETRLTEVRYTTCPRDRPAWELRMGEMLIDQVREVGATRSATLYWREVPILPFGNSSFSIGEGRKTGFLAPSYTTSTRLGLDVRVPFYWNIAPQHDMTFYPRLITKRGVQLGNELRFLRPNAAGTAAFEVLPDDSQSGTTRHFGSLMTSFRPADNLTIGLNVQRASDNNYFSDLGNTLLVSAQRLLPGSITMNAALAGWAVQAEAQEFQLLQDVGAPLIRPYSFAPKLAASRGHRAAFGEERLPIDWNVSGELAAFRHPTLAEGERVVGTGSVTWRHFSSGVAITPKLAMHATHYSTSRPGDGLLTAQKYSNAALGVYTNNVGAAAASSYTRVLPTFSTDVSTTFDRPLRIGDAGIEQTLEPRISYIYTPYQNQSNFPVFDTGSPSLNFAQLFSDRAFNGHDRIADLNQITAGVTTRFIEQSTGAERLRAAVGQRFYFSDQRVTLPGGTARTDRRSDLLGQATVRPRKDLTIDSLARYTLESSEWQSFSLVSRYNPKPANALSVAYRFVRDSSNTVDVAVQWPVAAHWYAVGRYQQALRNVGGVRESINPGLVEALAGFEYDGGCWVGRIVAQQYAANATQRNTTLFFQIELNGLGRVGTDPIGALRRNIPNYRSINEITPLPSKFDNFQ